MGLAALPSVAAATPAHPAQAVLTRLIGRRANDFMLDIQPGSAPAYAYDAHGGRVTVTASSPVAAVRGAYAYLSDFGLAHTSWEGDRVALPRRLPQGGSGPVTSPFAHRVYMNTCTFGYTTPFWDWKRWRREIDWMALHGIDMPLAMEGQEWVWRELWRGEGLDDRDLDAYFSGPAFTPWQRMGNIEGYQAPLPLSWIVKKRELQKRILGAMRELGMEPILPAFAGYVPKAFAESHPQARIYRMRAWEGFHETYWLDPADPLFAKLAGRFLDLYDQTYGKGRFYLADAFNEMLPPVGDGPVEGGYGDSTANKEAVAEVDPAVKAERLAAYGQRLHDSIRSARPDAVWVMQGWLFGADQGFWTGDAIAAFLRNVPDDGLMVLDIGNDRYPKVRQTAQAFHGKGWIYGYVHNYGASNPIYGDLGFYRRDMAAITSDPARGRLQGFGVFPEGLDSNSIVYAYLYDLAWNGGTKSLSDWLAGYTRARYGISSPEVVTAWLDIVKGVYGTRYWTPRWWRSTAGAYLLCKRPDIAMADFEGAPGDRAALRAGLARLAAIRHDSPLLRYDVIEFTRHLASLHLDNLIRTALVAYRDGDVAAGDRSATEVRRVTIAIDDLMGAQPCHLAGWIEQARAYGDTATEKPYYERNARAQVTVWGGKGNLHDYASKAWQGLYRDFYLPRWEMLFAALRTGTYNPAATTERLIAWENAWVESKEPVAHRVPSDAAGDAARLLAILS
ncbi:alpha-N-acetylglucosaminidase NAGLU family protein [Asticcacaulis biprosthecium C19]|uniref:Alpha-N-acetylglucosaminidase NAGLU family protein n=1 Tax=Asticcacaulis biprosthecium C19 TaxID=715226 RepID=F4QU83_9CAUL|nr:alpha-N-acetylglucosaminidase NAGLU family protein [Asticcacaulis biprosthecium C19]